MELEAKQEGWKQAYQRVANNFLSVFGVASLHFTSALDVCRRRWHIELDRRQVVELESSTPAKWSRHLVVRLSGRAFKHNGHMGRFVEALLDAPEVYQISQFLCS